MNCFRRLDITLLSMAVQASKHNTGKAHILRVQVFHRICAKSKRQTYFNTSSLQCILCVKMFYLSRRLRLYSFTKRLVVLLLNVISTIIVWNHFHNAPCLLSKCFARSFRKFVIPVYWYRIFVSSNVKLLFNRTILCNL